MANASYIKIPYRYEKLMMACQDRLGTNVRTHSNKRRAFRTVVDSLLPPRRPLPEGGQHQGRGAHPCGPAACGCYNSRSHRHYGACRDDDKAGGNAGGSDYGVQRPRAEGSRERVWPAGWCQLRPDVVENALRYQRH